MAEQAVEDDLGIFDLEADEVQEEESFFENVHDLAQEEEQGTVDEASFLETIGDILTQGGLGYLKAYTWPLDILKLGVLSSGLEGLDELESAAEKSNIPFDREEYLSSLFKQSQYIPTQELAEQGVEELTGLSLQPKSEIGKFTKQAVNLFKLSPGSVVSKATKGAAGAGATQALKATGVPETAAEVIGDFGTLVPGKLIEKTAKTIPQAAKAAEQTAQKHTLPFLEYMVREREPIVTGRLFKQTERNLSQQFNTTADEALKKIVRNEIPISRLRERGVNLDAFGEHAYKTTERLAQGRTQVIPTKDIVKNIDAEIARIEGLAPSPSDAQKASIKVLEQERDALKVAKPTSQQMINQHKNYNADVKGIYRKPEFNGKEEEVRKTYEFLKDQLVKSVEAHGQKDVANAFRASNKIWHEKSKLDQTQKILSKAFPGDQYNPKKLDKLLNSRDGKFLRRNLSKSAIQDIEEIAKYGKEAQEKMARFIDLRSPAVLNEVRLWGQLAPLIFSPSKLKGTVLSLGPALSKRVQGEFLTRPAVRDTYKLTLKHASEGAYDLLRKDFGKLETQITKEFGSIDNFIDKSMEDLEIFGEE